MQLLRFRAGVSGRRNVHSYLAEKHARSVKMTTLNKEEAYSLYQQQSQSYSDEPVGFADDNASKTSQGTPGSKKEKDLGGGGGEDGSLQDGSR